MKTYEVNHAPLLTRPCAASLPGTGFSIYQSIGRFTGKRYPDCGLWIVKTLGRGKPDCGLWIVDSVKHWEEVPGLWIVDCENTGKRLV